MRSLLLAAATALTTALLTLGAQAQDNPILVGAGIRSRPAYDGSKSQRTDIIPVLRYYGDPWFARTTQGILEAGIRNELAPAFWAGAQIAYEAGRSRSESPFLEARNEPDLHAGASAGLHLEWDRKLGPLPIGFLIRARQHLEGGRGAQADLRITAGVLSRGGLQAGVFTQATWATPDAVRSMYGTPGGGLLFVSAGVLGSLDLGRHWLVVGSLELRSLRDEAALSALAERRSNRYASAGLAYRF
jgi:outer membrane scaffolding protein for murein synthesis (MipA/OmpV family)